MNDGTDQVCYPIRVVSRRTGLKPDTVRAWERRYAAVTPSRSDGGHRLYSDSDIRRLRLLRRATEAGHSIGQIAQSDEGSLLKLLAADGDRKDPRRGSALPCTPFVEACLEAVDNLDGHLLEQEIQRAAVALGRQRLVDELLTPLIAAVGLGYEEGTLRPMHEHLLCSVVTGFARDFRAAFPPSPSAPSLVVSTPAHQHHELGAILAANVACSEGWNVTYLGANLPAEEIAAAARIRDSAALALSIVFPPDDPQLGAELRRLRQSLSGLPIMVGGQAVGGYESVLAEIDALVLTDFRSFRRALATLRQQRSRHASR